MGSKKAAETTNDPALLLICRFQMYRSLAVKSEYHERKERGSVQTWCEDERCRRGSSRRGGRSLVAGGTFVGQQAQAAGERHTLVALKREV